MWPVFAIVWDFLLEFVFGSEIYAAAYLLFALFVALLAARVDFKFALLALVPLSYGVALQGFLGEGWVKYIVILLLSVMWAFVLWGLVEK